MVPNSTESKEIGAAPVTHSTGVFLVTIASQDTLGRDLGGVEGSKELSVEELASNSSSVQTRKPESLSPTHPPKLILPPVL